MFSWNIHSSYDSARFILTVPVHYMAIALCSIPVFAMVVLGLEKGHAWKNYAILAALLVGYGFVGYSSEVTLDRLKNTVTVREFSFYHWSTRVFDLSKVEQVYVATGTVASQLRLQFTDGHVYSVSMMDDSGGKNEVAFRANEFLGKNLGQQ